LQVSEIREFALMDADSVRTDHVRLMPRASKAAADALMSRRWLVVVAETPAFITSDDPVVLLRGSCWRPKYGLGSPGTIVNFAVSPFRFLVLADEWERTFDHGMLDNADVFVRRIISGANRFVFSAEKMTRSRAQSPRAISANETVSREFEQFFSVMICAPAAKRSSFPRGSKGAKTRGSAARTAQMITR
jgi:hypothetical protein